MKDRFFLKIVGTHYKANFDTKKDALAAIEELKTTTERYPLEFLLRDVQTGKEETYQFGRYYPESS